MQKGPLCSRMCAFFEAISLPGQGRFLIILTSVKFHSMLHVGSDFGILRDFPAMTRRLQCLTLLCLVLLWDVTVAGQRESSSEPNDSAISICKVLPIAMRYREMANTCISLPPLLCTGFCSEDQFSPGIFRIHFAEHGVLDSCGKRQLIRLMSFQC